MNKYLIGNDFLFHTTKFKLIENRLFYEGYVRLCDEGYYKTIYVNTYIPHSKETEKPFYIQEAHGEVWTLLLVKALAKYFGSYEDLRQTRMNDLSTALFGCVPFKVDEACKQHFDQKYPKKTADRWIESGSEVADFYKCIS